MRLDYYPETDSLHIDLAWRPSVETREICDGILLDFDAEGRLVGIDIDHASSKIDLAQLIVSRLPSTIETSPN